MHSSPRPTAATTALATVSLAALAALAGLAAPTTLAAQTPAGAATADGRNAAAVERALESRSKGSTGTGVVVFEIADFQCPYCARFAESIAPSLHETFVETGRVEWVFVNLPLASHPRAWHAAEAALCAGAAGDRFWPMHDRLFAEQDAWGSADDMAARFTTYATELGVPAEPYRKCVVEDQVAGLILQDMASAVSAGITGTPTFIIMKDQQVVERLVGLQPVEEWTRALEAALQ